MFSISLRDYHTIFDDVSEKDAQRQQQDLQQHIDSDEELELE